MKLVSLLVVLCFGLVPSVAQGVNPVAKVREYNGTYSGGAYTGSVGFTTLYRDNQDNGVTSGCRGEGCGRHPGVDISVASGTEVKSVYQGTVMISRCDPSWGGLIVVKSNHPTRPWESIFHSYAHLKSRTYGSGLSVSVGDYISEGTVIGKSGGSSSDNCRGSSTGAHLHFQIDKDDGNPEPYFPSQSLLNTKDSSYFVAGKTYNPLVFVNNGYRWRFAQTGNRELWDLFNFQTFGVNDNALWMDGGYDPYIRRGSLTNCGLNKPCSSFMNAEASEYDSVYLDVFNQCAATGGKIYFTTKDDGSWNESKVVAFNMPSGTSFRNYIFMAWHPKWSGVITGLRVDPSENCNPSGFDPTYYGEIDITR